MSEHLSRQKCAKLLEQATALLARGEPLKAAELAQQVAEQGDFKTPLPWAIWIEARLAARDAEGALEVCSRGLELFPKDLDLAGRAGATLNKLKRFSEALGLLERAKKGRERDPGFLIQLGYAQIQVGQATEAEQTLIRAVSAGGGPEAKLVLAVARGKLGQYADAEKLLVEVERAAPRPDLQAAAKSARADARLFQGDAAGALALWRVVKAAGGLDPEQLAHMAYAAQLSGDPGLCDALMAERSGQRASPEDLLLFAQIANLRGTPEVALERLTAAQAASGARPPAFDFEAAATRGRALRMLGRVAQAREILTPLSESPEGGSARLGPKVRVDLGHLAAEEGDFETAAEHFKAALALDPGEPEARHALSLTERRVLWRSELTASAEAQVEAAKAEADALKRRFTAREGELDQLRRELLSLQAKKHEAEARARQAEKQAQEAIQTVAVIAEARAREERTQRESDAEVRALANVSRSLEGVSCPPHVVDALKMAERTFQTALDTDLPAAAVAVLYTGALERALYALFVERFRVWLREGDKLAAFLQGAVRERRGTRVEYFDHFVEAFDEQRPGKAPSMGEVGRVLEKRNEPHLKPFGQFLAQTYRAPDSFYQALAAFVLWSKESLRDPVAHGRMEEVGYEQLKRFREQLLFSFEGKSRGALALLLA